MNRILLSLFFLMTFLNAKSQTQTNALDQYSNSSSWQDTTLKWCAERTLPNGSLVHWFYQTSIYSDTNLTEEYTSFDVSGNTYYNQYLYSYFPHGYKRDEFSSIDSMNWSPDGYSRYYNDNNLDSQSFYSWDMNASQYLLQSATISYKDIYGLDSVKHWDGYSNMFQSKEVYYRSNGEMDSLVIYENNGGWNKIASEIFDSNGNSLYTSLIYQPYKTYRDSSGNSIAQVNYDMNWNFIDSSYTYYVNDRVDSIARFDNLLVFKGASSYTYSAIEEKRFDWNYNSTLVLTQSFHFNQQGNYIGRQSKLGDGTLYSRVSLCAIYDKLKIEEARENELLIYPNPTANALFINTDTEQSCDFEIIDMHGRIIQKGSMEKGTIELDLSSRPIGIYIIRIISDNGIICKRFQKQ